MSKATEVASRLDSALSEGLGCNAQTARERAMLFSAPMVRALLARTKTQTRRVMRTQPDADWQPAYYGELHGLDKHGELTPDKIIGWGPVTEDGDYGYVCPYGAPGDRLWVREAFSGLCDYADEPPSAWGTNDPIWFWADGNPPSGDWTRPKPSIHMPRFASRITLDVTAVRVERLHDISRGDAMDEGCPFPNMAQGPDPRQWYADLWDQINGHGAWSANPWVWVLAFRRCQNLQPNVAIKRGDAVLRGDSA